MIIEVLGWKFVDVADADFYMKQIDDSFGFPNDQTIHYTFYVIGSYEDKPVYYLIDDPTLYSILGEPYLIYLYSPL